MSYLLRLVVPDRPGTLGAVATALGTAGADIVSAGRAGARRRVRRRRRGRRPARRRGLPDSLISAAQTVDGR